MIVNKSEHITVKGHRGTWYVIDNGYFTPNVIPGENTIGIKHLFLLEHEIHGDEAACVIVDEAGELILADVWNGFDDLITAGWEKADAPELHSWYFTFGTDPAFKYRRGWVEVRAKNGEEACEKFRARCPDRPGHEGTLNCAFVYSEESWKRTIMATNGSNMGEHCHEVIE